jgi:hypothetical protein
VSDDNGTVIPFGRKDGSESNNGVSPEGLDAAAVPFEEIEHPVDLVAVQADDELINALAAGMSVSSPGLSGYDADDHVAAVLAAWKAEVEAEDIPELVDVETAVTTIEAARRPSGRARHLAPLAAAAAFIVLAIGGLSVSSYSAEPGDALWGISKVLYSERATSVEAAARAETAIDNAKQALMQGQPVVAEQELKKAKAELGSIRAEEGAEQLAKVQDFLAAKAAETPPGQPTDPGSPLKSDKTRQPPHGTAANEDPTTDPSEEPSTSEEPTKNPATHDPRTTRPEPATGGNPSQQQSDPSTSKGDPRTLRSENTGPTSSPDRSTSAPAGPDDRTQTQGPTKPANPSATSEGKPEQTTRPDATTSAPPPSEPSSDATTGPN